MNIQVMFQVLKSNIHAFGMTKGMRLTFNNYTRKYRKNFDIAEKYLEKRYKATIEKYKVLEKNVSMSGYSVRAGRYIWALWLTGYNSAPELVKKCSESLKKHSSGFEVILLDEKSINEYVDIPDYIWDKYYAGVIGPAHFSDIVRVKLLNKYGGVWLDAKVFLSGDFTTDIWNNRFYSPHRISNQANYRISIADRRWICGIMSTNIKNYLLFSFISEMYDLYWRDHSKAIVYLLLDTFIDIAVKNFINVKKDIESIPVTDDSYYSLSAVLNETYDEDEWKRIMQATDIHILSTKIKLLESNSTFYSVIVRNEKDYL